MTSSNHETVLCRSLGDQPLVRAAWSMAPGGVMITTLEFLRRWQEKGTDPCPVLAPPDSIYQYNEGLFHRLEEAFRHSPAGSKGLADLWQEATPYAAKSGAFLPVTKKSVRAADSAPSTARIKVVGVGGGGCSALRRMIRERIPGVEFVAMSTNVNHLAFSEAALRVELVDGKDRTRGCNGDPLLGWKAGEASRAQIEHAVAGADMVFVTAGLGGGTGTGAAPVVAQIARQSGALTIAIVTRPFSFEGPRRADVAEEGVSNLADKVDAMIITSNDRLIGMAPENATVGDALNLADEVICQGVQGIAGVVTSPGLINLDLADVRVVMKDAGSAWMSIGRGSGEGGVMAAAREALSSKLVDVSMEGARAVLFNVTGSQAITLFDVNNAAQVIRQTVDPEARIFFGIVHDPSMGDNVRLTLIAAGFPDLAPIAAPIVTPHYEIHSVESN